MISYKMYGYVLLIVIKFTFALNAFDHLILSFKDFISLACKFTALEKKSHSLLDDSRIMHFVLSSVRPHFG